MACHWRTSLSVKLVTAGSNKTNDKPTVLSCETRQKKENIEQIIKIISEADADSSVGNQDSELWQITSYYMILAQCFFSFHDWIPSFLKFLRVTVSLYYHTHNYLSIPVTA